MQSQSNLSRIIDEMATRRKCQYRESPRRCCINIPGHSPSTDEADNYSSLSSVDASRSSFTPFDPSITSSSSSRKSSSFIRIGNQHQASAAAATTFAAAVSPTSAFTGAHKKKHSSLFNRTNIMSTPLLGTGESSSAPVTKRSRGSSSFLSFAAAGRSSKRLDSSSGDTGSKKKRRSLSKTILAAVSSKVKRGGKKRHSAPSSPSYSRYDTASSSEMSSAHLRSSSHSQTLKRVAESSESLEIEGYEQAEESTLGGFISLEPEKQVDADEHRLTPLSFDDTKVPNHFRGLQVDTAFESSDGFSLNKVLSPSVEGHERAESSESPICEDFLRFLNSEDESKCASVTCDTPVCVSPLESEREYCDPEPGLRRSSLGNLSMPSLSDSCDDCAVGDNNVIAQVPLEAVKDADEAADSALVWGALGMILGSPAPQLVKSKKKRTPVNLWQDSEEGDCELDDMISLPQDDASSAQEEVSEALSREDENRLKFNQALERVNTRRSRGVSSTPQKFNDSYLSVTSKMSRRSSVSGGSKLSRSSSSQSISSIPSIVSRDDGACSSSEIPIISAEIHQAELNNTDEAADSALVWGALGMILGSPAPQLVMPKKQKRTPVNLWQDSDEAVSDDLDDIISLPQDEDVSDDCSIPSVSQEELNEDLVPDIDDFSGFDVFSDAAPQKSSKEIADSTLVWTALTAILGSPAPSSVVRRSASKERINLWEESDHNDVLPEIGEEDDVLSLPSIDQNESSDVGKASDFEESNVDKTESADSVLVWSALGMFLGQPAPKSLRKKKNKEVKNLWEEDNTTENNDALDTIPSLDFEDENNVPDVGESEEMTLIPTPVATSINCLPLVAGDDSSVKEVDQDDHIMPSLSVTYDGEDDDTHSIPSVAGTSDDEDPISRTGSFGGSYDDVTNSPKSDSSKKELTDSVLAWGAFAALMNTPAPKAALPKRKKEARDLWSNYSDSNSDIQSLIGEWEEMPTAW